MGDGSTYDDVVGRCNKHAIFLISQFMQDDGVVDWKATTFYKWMKSENAVRFPQLRCSSTSITKFANEKTGPV